MSPRQSVSLCILVLLLCVSGTTPTLSQTNRNAAVQEYRQHELIVTLKPGANLKDFNARQNTHFLKQIPGTNTYLVGTPADVLINDKMSDVAKDHSLAAASRNYIIKSAELLQISHGFVDQISHGFVDQISHGFVDNQSPTNFYGQPATNNLHLAEAHNLATGIGVRVAVIDTGVDLNHPLFAGRLAYPMYDFVDSDGLPQDELGGDGTGHGTFVSGLIALSAPQATIMPLRAFGNDGSGTSFDIASAIHFAADNGARVLNMSFGFTEEDSVVQEALSYALPSTYMVAAAGNDNLNFVHYPAADTSKTLSVTATTNNDLKAPFANFHSTVQVAAPGVSVYSAYPGNQWAWWSGTSFSTPLVSGEVALLLSVRPNLSWANLNMIITSSGVNIDSLNANYAGQLGRVRIDYLSAVNLALTY
jgi:subtilisin family serine protease